MIEFEVPGNPQGLKRHRAFRMGNGLRMVDPSAGDKQDFLTLALSAKPDKPADTAIEVHCEFIFQRPRSHYRTGKNAHLLKEQAPYFHTGTPDTDNLTKFVGDSLNGIFWKDDSFICKLSGVKRYSNSGRPRVIVKMVAATEPKAWRLLL